jgi:hypothetical protein
MEPNNPDNNTSIKHTAPGKQNKHPIQLQYYGMSSAAKHFMKWWQLRVEVKLSLYRPEQTLRSRRLRLPIFPIRTLT